MVEPAGLQTASFWNESEVGIFSNKKLYEDVEFGDRFPEDWSETTWLSIDGEETVFGFTVIQQYSTDKS